jgi:hypothetical protein
MCACTTASNLKTIASLLLWRESLLPLGCAAVACLMGPDSQASGSWLLSNKTQTIDFLKQISDQSCALAESFNFHRK